MTKVLHLLLLVTVWVALWSDVSVANVISGVAVALAIILLFGTRRSGQIIIRPLRALQFAGYFAYKLVEATVVVAQTVIMPRDRIRTGIVSVELQGCSDAVVTIIADAITHTPGTLTLEVRREPLTLVIHVLQLRDVEQVRRDVRKLEVLAVRAFGTAEALAGLREDDTDAWEGAG